MGGKRRGKSKAAPTSKPPTSHNQEGKMAGSSKGTAGMPIGDTPVSYPLRSRKGALSPVTDTGGESTSDGDNSDTSCGSPFIDLTTEGLAPPSQSASTAQSSLVLSLPRRVQR